MEGGLGIKISAQEELWRSLPLAGHRSRCRVLLHLDLCSPTALLLAAREPSVHPRSQPNLRLSGAKTRTSTKPPMSITAARPAPAGCGGHLGRECRGLGRSWDYGCTPSSPITWEPCLPHQTGSSLGAGAVSPPSGQGFSGHRVVGRVALSLWGLHCLHHAVV